MDVAKETGVAVNGTDSEAFKTMYSNVFHFVKR